MPRWSESVIEPPWSKEHTVCLKGRAHYEEIAERGGSDKVERHKPMSLGAGTGRAAGTSGVQEEPHAEENRNLAPVDGEGWQKALEDGSRVVSVRDIKLASPDYKTMYPRHHAFARFVLPIKSTAFSQQDWPGKKEQEEKAKKKAAEKDADDKNDAGDNGTEKKGDDSDAAEEDGGQKDEPQMDGGDEDDLDKKQKAKKEEMSPEQERFLEQLLDEMRVQTSMQNNDAQPIGDLKLLDEDALAQLESCLAVEDQSTPDSWIPRSARLLRLAGTHPLNAEPNVNDMFDAGMITPTKLHYVRSHGPVPQLTWEHHRLSVFGDPPELMTNAKDWTMDELTRGDFRIYEFPVTIACDGNRRKEMSMIKQAGGIGFTTAGVSTCLWRGVHVRDVLLASGLQDQPDHERWWLHIEGADECSEGYYATSIPLMHAMDVTNDVLLAFGQNGRVLHPDHGYPLRCVTPGYVGGRQVKWVHKLWVAKEPNMSHYHIWDNRIVPPFITSKEHPLARAFFHSENSACMDQILNSAICRPRHNERVPLTTDKGGAERLYKVEGFAYNGSGTPINRVELTLDGGKTWKYCIKHYWDKPLRHGEKHWAWIFWSCEVPLQDLSNAAEVAVRACDGHMQCQPEHIAWNMTGMMNNSWYRIRSNVVTDPNTKQPLVHFIHPVGPGKDDDGWMKPNPEDADQSSGGGTDRVLSLEEIAKHDKRDDAWIIIDNKVYDVTSVLDWHPGGAEAIMPYAGKATVDTTSQYKGIHDNYANMKRDECLIGVLSPEAAEEMEKDAQRAAEALAKLKEERKGLVLQPDMFVRATLVERKEVSHDTRIYVFQLPKNEDGGDGVLGLPVGQHVMLSIHFEDQGVLRAYTPIYPVLPEEENGTITFCVKTYFPTDGGPYPPGGLVSNYLDCMKEGEELDMRGPMGEIVYKGKGSFVIEGKDYKFDRVNLVAGGSGLTPHWQFIHAVLSDKSDETRISMIDCNKTFEDILMHDELQKYAEECPDRFKLWHALSKAPEGREWPYPTGHLDVDLMKKQFYPPEDGVLTLLCGPGGLIEKAAIPGLEEIGFKKGKNIFGY